jgi:hypothetical protein
MSMNDTIDKLEEIHDTHREKNFHRNEESLKHWRAWGSWFSWGSPVGLGICYALVVISTAFAIWLFQHR